MSDHLTPSCMIPASITSADPISSSPVSAARIASLPYAEGAYPDRLLDGVVRQLQDQGLVIAGVVQHDLTRANRTRCEMNLEDLASGEMIGLSEDRGPEARGCRIDQSGLVRAAGLIRLALETGRVDLVVINKFGKIESEGGGLRDVIALAVAMEIPVVVGVPQRNLDAWNAFADQLDISLPLDHAALLHWIGARVERTPA